MIYFSPSYLLMPRLLNNLNNYSLYEEEAGSNLCREKKRGCFASARNDLKLYESLRHETKLVYINSQPAGEKA